MKYHADLVGVLDDGHPITFNGNCLEHVENWARLTLAHYGGEVHIYENKPELIKVIKLEG